MKFWTTSSLGCVGVVCASLLMVAIAGPVDAAKIGARETDNRYMAEAASPYLQTHKRDLVEWREWNDETFALSRKLGKPIMVSFGYTACHWCHVMQATHFNDPVLSAFINKHFVPVLVDRERRETLDETYMLVTEALTGRGGWPNTVFLSPDLLPIYGTGYVPIDEFTRITDIIANSWQTEQPQLLAQGIHLANILQEHLTRTAEAKPVTADVLAALSKTLVAQFDTFNGGMGTAPKFFQAPVLMLLLQLAERSGDAEALKAVENTLKAVASGGIHDHLAGGFHRYAVDPGWRVPHFEKMLYDQAQMSEAFVTAFRITGNADYADVARKTFDYVLADLTAPAGGFYSTRDADSEGHEGTFYVWTRKQLTEVLGADDAAYAVKLFGEVADGEFAGKVIINLDQVRGQSLPRLPGIFERLSKVRVKREHPRRDEKVVVSWNGLMIASLAQAAMVLKDEKYGKAAARAGEFIWQNMRCEAGMLKRVHYEGKSLIEGELHDYAYLARAYLFLFDLTEDKKWLERAKSLAKIMSERFMDEKTGDFFSTAGEHGFGRTKSRSDVDLPSGNAVALDVFGRLSRRSPDMAYRNAAKRLGQALSGIALTNGVAGAAALSAIDRFKRGETGPVQYAGRGMVRIAIDPMERGKAFKAEVSVAPGWHVNANKPLEKHLIATTLDVRSGDQIIVTDVTYPEPLKKRLEFNEKPLALYEGRFTISAAMKPVYTEKASAVIEVQTCSDEICLLPETLSLGFAFP